MRDLEERIQQYGAKDTEIIDKFCKPRCYPLLDEEAADAIEVPALVSKLIEVEYLLHSREAPNNVEQTLYKKYVDERGAKADPKGFKQWLSDQALP